MYMHIIWSIFGVLSTYQQCWCSLQYIQTATDSVPDCTFLFILVIQVHCIAKRCVAKIAWLRFVNLCCINWDKGLYFANLFLKVKFLCFWILFTYAVLLQTTIEITIQDNWELITDDVTRFTQDSWQPHVQNQQPPSGSLCSIPNIDIPWESHKRRETITNIISSVHLLNAIRRVINNYLNHWNLLDLSLSFIRNRVR